MMHSLSSVVVARELMILGSFGDATLGLPERQSLQHVAIAVYEDDHPVASALVAAHLGGFETVAGWRKDKGNAYAADRAVLDGAAVQGSIPPPSPDLSAAATWRKDTAEGSQQGLSSSGIRVPSLPPVARASTSLACCKGDGHKGYFATELLRQYGLSNATDDVGGMMDTYKRSGITALVVAVNQALAAKAGIHWSTTSHTSVDIDLYDAAGGGAGKGNRVLGRVVRCWLN
ncbi:hypothetical protein ARSEF4850_007467 [Beauveria asiatica]